MNKLDRIAALFVEESPDIVLITESWTNSDIKDAEISFAGYTIVERSDRKTTQKGR